MKKIKGIVVEQNKESVIILTPDGRFIKGESKGQQIGSESLVLPAGPKSRRQLSALRKLAAVGLLAAVFLILLSAIILPFREPALAFIQLEVNPAVEFGIDRKGKVRELTPLNDDGSALIQQFGDWDGKDATELLDKILAKYSEADRELTVTSVKTGDEKLADVVGQTVDFIKEAAREEGMQLRLSEADSELRDRAMTEGVPISRLIEPGRHSGDPSSSRLNQKTIDEKKVQVPAEHRGLPAANNSNQEAGSGPDRDSRLKTAGEIEFQPPGNSGHAPGIMKKDTSPPVTVTQEKPDDKPKPVPSKEEKQKKPDVQGEKPEEPPKPDKAGPHKGPSEKGKNGSSPAHAGPDNKNPPPGHAGQGQQPGPPAHAGPKPKERPEDKPGRDDWISPPQKNNPTGHGQPSNNGQQNKNGGNGKGGNGNGK